MAKSKAKLFVSIADTLLETPLYTQVNFNTPAGQEAAETLFKGTRFDGYCPYCHRQTTFSLRRHSTAETAIHRLQSTNSFSIQSFHCTCAREANHVLTFVAFMTNYRFNKIGQWPSLADIANDESKKYSSVLDERDSGELHTAIGLSAHGIGIGSYVYLRRVFERLVWGRFKEFSAQHGWNEQEFARKRMDEKIDFLKEHLPATLVKNKAVYSILSAGLHELTEDECRQDFSILHQAILMMLDEDQERQAKKQREEVLSNAIKERAAAIKNKGKAQVTDDEDSPL